MVAVTSISPTHLNKDIQALAIKSWIDLGMKAYSFNSESEIELLEEHYRSVTFIKTHRTMEHAYGKPLVSISSVLDFCKDHKEEHFLLINSDIELKTDKPTIERIKGKMVDAIVLGNRVDYEKDYSGHRYLLGIDAFFIHKRYLSLYPQSMHCFGMTFWDYEIPYTALKSGVDVVFLKQDIAYHKIHAFQYSHDNWLKSGRYFLWQHGLYQFNDTKEIGKMSQFVYHYIYNGSKRIEI